MAALATTTADVGIGLYLEKFYGWYSKKTGQSYEEVINQVLLDFAIGSFELMDDDSKAEAVRYLRESSRASETAKS